MRHVWRWFGPVDKVTLADARQTGAQAIVSALHHIPAGEVWPAGEIDKRRQEVARLPDGSESGLVWEVVESLPVSEAIKTQAGDWRQHVANYKVSLENLARRGLFTVCYNFMPVLDWTRTDLAWRVAHGGATMRFDLIDFAAFDIGILARDGATADYAPEIARQAALRLERMDAAHRARLSASINCGLPGDAGAASLDALKGQLARYRGIDAQRLRANFVAFLEEIVPSAERLGVRLCCHPDDPPFPLLGLPRILSTEEDYRFMLDAVDSPANGVTLCTGSLGARPDNDLPGMARRLGPRIHFAHLRNVRRETPGTPCSFHEAEHLDGDTDMVAVVRALLGEEARRRAEGRADAAIPMRPDHGQDILDDLKRGAQPGYPAIGRLKGLAELRGVERALGDTDRFPKG
jgi:mannonate dehydratase